MSMVSNPRVGFPNWLPRWKSKHLKVRGTRYRSHSLFSFLYLSCPQNMASPIWKSHYWEERLYKHCLKNGTCLLFLENISLEEIKFIRGQSYKSKIIWSLNLRGPWLEFGTVPPPSFPLHPMGQPKLYMTLGGPERAWVHKAQEGQRHDLHPEQRRKHWHLLNELGTGQGALEKFQRNFRSHS